MGFIMTIFTRIPETIVLPRPPNNCGCASSHAPNFANISGAAHICKLLAVVRSLCSAKMAMESTDPSSNNDASEAEAAAGHQRHRRVSLQHLLAGANDPDPGPGESQSGTLISYKETLSIPIREEFRLTRLWFFYHDLRAFTTSVG